MAEVEELCDRVIFINHGKIISDDTPTNLAKKIEVSHIELMIQDGLKRVTAYCRENNLNYRMESKRYIVIDVKEKEIANILRELMERGIIYDEISIEKPTLEDYFLEYAKEEK
jgi:ABC-2 type transport system ATP-binding protein